MRNIESQGPGAGTRKLVYIMSPSFAGSTLLTLLLARHPEISTVGELKGSALGDVTKYCCSCGKSFESCSFWRRLFLSAEEIGTKSVLDDLGTHFRSGKYALDRILRATVGNRRFEWIRKFLLQQVPAFKTTYSDILVTNEKLIDLICDIQGGPVFLDGSKDPNRLMYFAKSKLFDLKIITLQRDGRGVCNSTRQHFGCTLDRAIHEWTRKVQEIVRTANSFSPGQVHRMTYEDLCRDPRKNIDEALEFLELESPAESHLRHTDDLHVLGNAMRLASVDEISLDEKWKRKFSSSDYQVFFQKAEKLNRSLGYR